MSAATTPCFEVVTFRPRAGIGRAEVQRALKGALPWLRLQPGFVSRRLLYDLAQDTWVDTVEWRSELEAHRAMEASATAPFAAALGELTDLATLRILHGTAVTPSQPA